ncbi:MAG TPA: hypothetical protein VHX86_10835 [Tepidisphaeraceae bacterium]|jgi:hypothetical protein|nr:hypothetical protein [Tepidisphaeraceae bacterium]
MADAIGAHNVARPEASFRLTCTAGSDEFSKSIDLTMRIVPALPTLQQLSVLAAQAADGVRKLAQ